MDYDLISKELDYKTNSGKSIRLAHCSGNSTTCGTSCSVKSLISNDFEDSMFFTLNQKTPSQMTLSA